ncbi:hypothetical protein [Halodesulfurarchaeum sp.]|uniref:hypothetical protein n=1 Tax=Halodesulfurarchaeum sp. TaxID=1980530 RepID=UPI001BBFCA02|nr:hypothetical protein [Halodesulfurarchaeum sp.]
MVSLAAWANGEGLGFVDAEAKTRYQTRTDHLMTLLKLEEPEGVREYCEDLIVTAGPDGFLLTPGATVYRGPAENLQAVIDATKNA